MTALTLWLPLRLVNPLNGAHGHWSRTAKTRRSHRDQTKLRTAAALREAALGWCPEQPKRITFLARVWNLFDDDGLRAALKPVRDGLIDARVIHSDGPRSGHEFVYRQVVDRARRGVEIHVALVEEALASSGPQGVSTPLPKSCTVVHSEPAPGELMPSADCTPRRRGQSGPSLRRAR